VAPTVVASPSEARPRAPRTDRSTTIATLAAWAALLAVAAVVGRLLLDAGYRLRMHTPPIMGDWVWRVDARALLPLAVGGAVAWWGPLVAARAPWRAVPWLSAATAAGWATSLALVDGWSRLTFPVALPGHYYGDVAKITSPGAFLSTFVADHARYGTHVQAHPPGFVLLLWAMQRLGLRGAGWEAALVVAVGAAGVAAVLVAVREVAGTEVARRAAPFCALAPVALMVATTEDAFFAGLGAGAVALIVLATGRSGRRADLLAVAGGLLFGATLMCSYGLVFLALPAVLVAVHRRTVRPLVLAAIVAAAVLLAFLPFGFWYLAGALMTSHHYVDGVARGRPYWYFVWANLAALGVLLGPAVTVAAVRLRDRRVWLLVGGAVAAITIADVSGMSKGEVARIWLPFALWVLPAGAALATRGVARTRAWLGAQAAFALLVQVAILTHW